MASRSEGAEYPWFHETVADSLMAENFRNDEHNVNSNACKPARVDDKKAIVVPSVAKLCSAIDNHYVSPYPEHHHNSSAEVKQKHESFEVCN